jgi:amidase
MIGEKKGLGEQDLERLLNPMTWRHYLKAKQFTVAEVFRMMNDNNTVTRQFGMVMNRYDVLLAPTCAVRVPPANGPYSLLAEEELDVWINRLVDAARYTIPANETGLPAISVPAGLDSDGLPIGVQFYGNFTGEDLLLRLAVQLEQAPPAVVRRPADGARGRLIPPTVVANTGSRRRRRTGRPGRHKRLPPDPT